MRQGMRHCQKPWVIQYTMIPPSASSAATSPTHLGGSRDMARAIIPPPPEHARTDTRRPLVSLHAPAVRALRSKGVTYYDPAMMPRRPRRCRVATRLILPLLLFAVLAASRPGDSAP